MKGLYLDAQHDSIILSVPDQGWDECSYRFFNHSYIVLSIMILSVLAIDRMPYLQDRSQAGGRRGLSAASELHESMLARVHVHHNSAALLMRRADSPAQSLPGLVDMAAECHEDESEIPAIRRTIPYISPETTTSMTFYPAPIPTMINLPPKLSRGPSPGGKQRPQILAPQECISPTRRQKRSLSFGGSRPSLFPDHPMATHDSRVGGDTATEILEQILEASVYTPVDTLTKHSFSKEPGALFVSDTTGNDLSWWRAIATQRISIYKRASHSMFSFAGFQSTTKLKETISNPKSGTESTTIPCGEMIRPFEQQSTNSVAALQARKQRLRSQSQPAREALSDGVYYKHKQIDAAAERKKLTWQGKPDEFPWGREEQDMSNDNHPFKPLYQDSQRPHSSACYCGIGYRPCGLVIETDLGATEPFSSRRSLPRMGGSLKHTQCPNNYGLQAPGLTDFQHLQEQIETLEQRLKHLEGEAPGLFSPQISSQILSHFGAATEPDLQKPTAAEERLIPRRQMLQTQRINRKPLPISK